jgi:hypothetical protein
MLNNLNIAVKRHKEDKTKSSKFKWCVNDYRTIQIYEASPFTRFKEPVGWVYLVEEIVIYKSYPIDECFDDTFEPAPDKELGYVYLEINSLYFVNSTVRDDVLRIVYKKNNPLYKNGIRIVGLVNVLIKTYSYAMPVDDESEVEPRCFRYIPYEDNTDFQLFDSDEMDDINAEDGVEDIDGRVLEGYPFDEDEEDEEGVL